MLYDVVYGCRLKILVRFFFQFIKTTFLLIKDFFFFFSYCRFDFPFLSRLITEQIESNHEL